MGMGKFSFAVYATAVVTSTLLAHAAEASGPSGPACAANAASILGMSPYTSSGSASSDDLTVDLGYGVYKGTHNTTSRVRSWKGVRYAAPPVGNLRWQKPRQPTTNTAVVNAVNYGPVCPQSPPAIPGIPFAAGDEDCLYINVYSPDTTSGATSGGTKKPVLVWIHGGGYGMGNGQNDLTDLLNDNNNEFVAVTIQYRLGAFGFLSSADVKANGLLNAGLLDQAFALMWVQQYIGLFGGDPSQVTISGESSGGGSVMYHTLAEGGGNTGLNLFQNAIAASPYLVPQYAHNAAVPSERYSAFAAAAGCSTAHNIWNCLVAADTLTLQYASSNVSDDLTIFATWAFVPVTDGTYIRQLPSQQLAAKKIGSNVASLLVGNNADEGALFVPGGIDTDAALQSWIQETFPGLSSANITELLATYNTGGPGDGGTVYSYPLDGPKFETDGTNWPTASDVSLAATGPQQRAYNIYGEATFMCTAYYLAEAFTSSGPPHHEAYQYQYSVPFAFHGSDVSAYLGPPTANQSPDFVKAFRQIWGGLVVRSNPSILRGGGSSPYTFPAWTPTSHQLVSLNTTGGTATTVPEIWGGTGIEYDEPGLQNAFKTANADTWEGGRAVRCEFWRSVAPYLPQ